MNKDTNDWLHELLKVSAIPSADVPNIDLYMDQITTFMDTHLADSRRYPDDKIMTKTMINNYTKNHLLPPSVKKKYSREHIFLLPSHLPAEKYAVHHRYSEYSGTVDYRILSGAQRQWSFSQGYL